MLVRTLVFSLFGFASLWTAQALCPQTANAWDVSLPDQALEKSLILVDKGEREFLYLEKNGNEITRLHYPSIHGEIEGDKQLEGDLKTPEGVYFVRGKIQVPLDFIMYGNHAYALNYPNPIDRLRGKTGSGIWIHSKGDPIAGQVTQGCVAIDLEHIKTLDSHLKPGTPVVIAQNIESVYNEKKLTADNKTGSKTDSITDNGALEQTKQETGFAPENNIVIINDEAEIVAGNSFVNKAQAEELAAGRLTAENTVENSETVSKLPENALQEEKIAVMKEEFQNLNKIPLSKDAELIRQATRDWNNAWQERSEEFFSFYNAENYSKTSGSFEAFKEQKKNLFETLSWIYIITDEIEVLEGPDYFVSWFKQFYLAPNHKTEGVRRLYWMKDESGEYKVVAMEWIQQPVDLAHKLDEKIQKEVPLFIENWRFAWETADLAGYASFYSANAIQDRRYGLEAIMEQKQYIWNLKKPQRVNFTSIFMSMEKEGLKVQMHQDYADSSGYSDKGIKTLILHPKGDSWVIFKELWQRQD